MTENRQACRELIRKIRKTRAQCSDDITWDGSGIDNLYAKIDAAAARAGALEKKIAKPE
jgi:hypothetical protein